MTLDAEKIKQDFPVLMRDWEDRPPLVYLDSACMTLRPRPVIEAVVEYYERHSACSGRSLHLLGAEVSRRVHSARTAMCRFLGASRTEEVVFTANTTASLNLLARGLGLSKGDVVVLSDREHNSNLVPWLALRATKDIDVRTVPSEDDWTFDTDRLQEALAPGDVKVVSFAQTTNVDGYTYPIREIAEIAHDREAVVVVDGAQSAAGSPVDVVELGVDFFACSVHKMLGPTGVGVLWGRYELLEGLEPVEGGGGAVASVDEKSFRRAPAPEGLESGLKNLSGIYGAEVAVDYLSRLGMEEVNSHELMLNRLATEALSDVEGLSILGPQDPELRGSILTFVVDGVDAHELGLAMDEMGNVAVRTGVHCNHSWFDKLGISGAVRASFYLYNTPADVGRFASTLDEAITAFRA